MNKIYWILGVVILITGALVLFGFWIAPQDSSTPTSIPISTSTRTPSNTTEVPGTQTQQPSTTQGGGAPLESFILVQARDGSSMQVKNFKEDPTFVEDTVNPGQYYLGYGLDATVEVQPSAPPYVIGYVDATDFFTIALLQESLSNTRKTAEQYLMRTLGINESQMCQLRYSLSVPNRVNSTYAGVDLKFSFCPGSVKLPKKAI